MLDPLKQGVRIDETALLAALRGIVGDRHVLTGGGARRFTTGYRIGGGRALAVARPGSLVELWRVLQACVAHGAAIIVQAANTGLTGGSTPGPDHPRPVVVINVLRIDRIVPIEGGRQVVCLAGSTLNQLERLLKPIGREPHSVIGSSCLGASVVGGVCNNSGGALVRRGPAYTELALFAQLGADGELRLVNRLGIELGQTPEEMLGRLDRADADAIASGVRSAPGQASAPDYAERVRDVDAATPARYNADPSRLYDAAGCAGKLAVFAVRLDSFASDTRKQSFIVATNDPGELAALRRTVLRDFPVLPVSGEYVHRDTLTLADRYGRDTTALIDWIGTERLPRFFAIRSWLDRRLGSVTVDRLLQRASMLVPPRTPPRIAKLRDRYAHLLIVTMADDGIEALTKLLHTADPERLGWIECTPAEAARASAIRYAAAGAAIRYAAVHRDQVADIVALDIALRRNDQDWFETLPPELEAQLVAKLYYGHFFCHVFHQDYLVAAGADPAKVEAELLKLVEQRGAKFPAEHNVGRKYPAEPQLAAHYQALDPLERFNPGIGRGKTDHR